MNTRTLTGLIMLVLTLGAILIITLAFPALAAPPSQDNILPTPTLPTVEDAAYELTTVGGDPRPVTLEHHETFEGFTLTDTKAQSLYPKGMLFTIGVESDAGEIEKVTWTLLREERFATRAEAEWDPDLQRWVATAWPDSGFPVGMEGYFSWRIRDTAGNIIETAPIFIVYTDPDRAWYRMESDDITIYWTGFGGDDPNRIARDMADYFAGVSTRFETVFGRRLSYKPLGIVYPDFASFAAMHANSLVSENLGGYTGAQGMGSATVQRMREPGVYGCPPWLTDYGPESVRIDDVIKTIGHELTHLYQIDMGGTLGPNWWSEGQAEALSNNAAYYDDLRLHRFAETTGIPTLHNELGSSTTAGDGCGRLEYDAGSSFVNWFMATQGGIETLGDVVQLQYTGVPLFDAFEQVTGKPFLEIENEWRAYHGAEPILPEDLDPSLALDPYEDPELAVGDVITLPASPAMSMIYEDPKPNALVSGSCWANMEAEILAMGQSDGVVYIQVDCMGQVGWMTRDQLVSGE